MVDRLFVRRTCLKDPSKQASISIGPHMSDVVLTLNLDVIVVARCILFLALPTDRNVKQYA